MYYSVIKKVKKKIITILWYNFFYRTYYFKIILYYVKKIVNGFQYKCLLLKAYPLCVKNINFSLRNDNAVKNDDDETFGLGKNFNLPIADPL